RKTRNRACARGECANAQPAHTSNTTAWASRLLHPVTMIVAAHQPSYLPWLGYFDKLAKVDLVGVMDRLPSRPRRLQSRHPIKGDHGPTWLTVPVQRDCGTRICDQLVDKAAKGHDAWQRRTWMTIVNHYRRAPYLPRYMDDLRFVFTQPWKRLVDLNMYILDL